MQAQLSVSAFSAGLLASFVGFASSFAIVVHGLRAVGASPEQAASGLMAAAVAMGICGIFLSFRTRMPVSVAWSTPGAAFLGTITPPDGGFPVVVGSFLVAAVLIILAGSWKRLGKLVSGIPLSLASAMLAGILLPFCLAPFEAIAQFPVAGLAVVGMWLVVGRLSKLLAVPAAILVAALFVVFAGEFDVTRVDATWPRLVFVPPDLSVSAIIGISIPSYDRNQKKERFTVPSPHPGLEFC